MGDAFGAGEPLSNLRIFFMTQKQVSATSLAIQAKEKKNNEGRCSFPKHDILFLH
jgi:hypothetical protein